MFGRKTEFQYGTEEARYPANTEIPGTTFNAELRDAKLNPELDVKSNDELAANMRTRSR